MRYLTYLLPLMLILWLADNLLSEDRTIGWERHAVVSTQRRWETSSATKIVLLGSSTSVDWMRPEYLARHFGISSDAILDAHINGCHQDCTVAEVKRLLHLKKRYRLAFFGTNQFQLCEYEHSKRVLQQVMMVPTEDVLSIFIPYGKTKQPLNYFGRFWGMTISGVYGDTSTLQERWARALFGESNEAVTYRWARRVNVAHKPRKICSYLDDEIAYKKALTEQLLHDLERLADKTILMLLPDEHLAEPATEVQTPWDAHRALHHDLAKRYPHVTVLDLSRGGAEKPEHFRDGFHVNAQGEALQQRLFERLMRDGGHFLIGGEP